MNRLKNHFLLQLTKLFGPLPKRDRSHRFLIVSTTGVGDTLWATPSICAIREKYPDALISVLTSQAGYQVLKHNPHINKIYTLKNASIFSFLSHYSALKKANFDTVFVFHASQRFALPFCRAIKPNQIIGSLGINKGLDTLLTTSIPRKHEHEIARRLRIIKCAGIEHATTQMQLFLTDKEKAETDHLAQENLPLIGLHPGANNSFKQWGKESCTTLGKKLATLGRVVVTGNKGEQKMCEEIARVIPNAISLAGNLSLRQTASAILKCDLFVTNDTGPMHIAYAMSTPTVALFGPTDPKLCGPFGASHATVLGKGQCCSPCLMRKCRDPFCMQQIGIDEVWQACKAALHSPCLV